MIVYVASYSKVHNKMHFHSSADCPQLTKKPPRGTAHEVVEVDLRELKRVVPCKTCYSDAPRPKSAKRYCKVCNVRVVRACPHNGGVPVYSTYATKTRTFLREPGDPVTRLIWVWPERAHLFYN